jgi:hypothetical protein
MTTPVASSDRMRSADDPNYAPFLRVVGAHFSERAGGTSALFTVDTEGLWETYLAAFGETDRQTYNCSACRQFVERFGGLITIEDDGTRTSAVWDAAKLDGMFTPVAQMMRAAVERRPVAAVFLAKEGTLGTPQTGAWFHLAVALPSHLAHRDRLLTPAQRAAGIRENVTTVERALSEFSPDALGEALRVLEADALSRAEKFIGPVRWLLDLHTRRAATKDERRRSAILWRAVATSPEGYSHPRASVIGPLLEGIIAGESYETLKAKFAEMLHPLRYQRPTAAPSAGNIAQAEKIVAQLGIERSLERRFARLDECETIWMPRASTPERPQAGGVFTHLAPKETPEVSPLNLPAQTMTWEKFARTVLPTAHNIAMYTPHHGNFMAFVTATHTDAPPIIRWDREEKRNPVTVYVYHGGSLASRWGVPANTWHPVTAISLRPNLWGTLPSAQHGEGLMLVLKGAVDSSCTELALFPETLRDDLREIRSTIEAFSKRGAITGAEDASACGYGIGKGHCDVRLRVTVDGRHAEYRIDRWD